MRTEHIISKDGTITSNVIDRQETNCQNSVKLMQSVGEITSDERTGPDCDEVHETTL